MQKCLITILRQICSNFWPRKDFHRPPPHSNPVRSQAPQPPHNKQNTAHANVCKIVDPYFRVLSLSLASDGAGAGHPGERIFQVPHGEGGAGQTQLCQGLQTAREREAARCW